MSILMCLMPDYILSSTIAPVFRRRSAKCLVLKGPTILSASPWSKRAKGALALTKFTG